MPRPRTPITEKNYGQIHAYLLRAIQSGKLKSLPEATAARLRKTSETPSKNHIVFLQKVADKHISEKRWRAMMAAIRQRRFVKKTNMINLALPKDIYQQLTEYQQQHRIQSKSKTLQTLLDNAFFTLGGDDFKAPALSHADGDDSSSMQGSGAGKRSIQLKQSASASSQRQSGQTIDPLTNTSVPDEGTDENRVEPLKSALHTAEKSECPSQVNGVGQESISTPSLSEKVIADQQISSEGETEKESIQHITLNPLDKQSDNRPGGWPSQASHNKESNTDEKALLADHFFDSKPLPPVTKTGERRRDDYVGRRSSDQDDHRSRTLLNSKIPYLVFAVLMVALVLLRVPGLDLLPWHEPETSPPSSEGNNSFIPGGRDPAASNAGQQALLQNSREPQLSPEEQIAHLVIKARENRHRPRIALYLLDQAALINPDDPGVVSAFNELFDSPALIAGRTFRAQINRTRNHDDQPHTLTLSTTLLQTR